MDSSPVLRQQSWNKIHSDFLRTRNEQNKVSALSRSPKVLSERQHFKQDAENKDPGNSESGRKLPVSRLPVLSRSLRLQTPSDFTQSHCRWEEKPLAGKAKNKKPCTRHLPFNLTQPKNSRTASENQQPQTTSQARTVHPHRNVHSARLKTQTSTTKPAQPPARLKSNVEPTTHAWRSNRGAAQHVAQPSGQSGLSNKSKPSASSSQPASSVPLTTVAQSRTPSSARAAPSAQACVDNMNLLSLKDPARTSHAAPNTQSSADKGEVFKPDHAALLSILRNEPIGSSATPRSRLYNPLPQRVSVMKSQQKAGAANGSMKMVRFSPEPSTLQSLQRSEAVMSGPQRVPVKKNRAGQPVGAMAASLRETPQKDWTPQRVPNTRHQPISAMKWHQRTPFGGTPTLWQSKTKLQPQQEEIVQRLFDDEEDEQSVKQLPVHSASAGSRCEAQPESSQESREHSVPAPPFIQAPERESVIFFSTGKSLLRVARFQQAEDPAEAGHQGPAQPGHQGPARPGHQGPAQPGHQDPAQPGHQDLVCPESALKPPLQSVSRDLALQRTCALALLQKRRGALAELRLDEEVSTYMSVPPSCHVPPRPRCGNPLASSLLFEESTQFVPVDCALSAPSSPRS